MVSITNIATAEWIQVSNAPAMEDDPEGRRIGWETLIKSKNEHEAVLIEQDIAEGQQKREMRIEPEKSNKGSARKKRKG
ncbi:hypothetical protein BZA77DRAFT_356398 [Pyronema omphalodes]|nr:hypothetical protein BZA77DRAFT_356398 [Pyronema omphalodes]